MDKKLEKNRAKGKNAMDRLLRSATAYGLMYSEFDDIKQTDFPSSVEAYLRRWDGRRSDGDSEFGGPGDDDSRPR
jgi:hypothetical protein